MDFNLSVIRDDKMPYRSVFTSFASKLAVIVSGHH